MARPLVNAEGGIRLALRQYILNGGLIGAGMALAFAPGAAIVLHRLEQDAVEGVVFWVFVAGLPFSAAVGFYGVVVNGFILGCFVGGMVCRAKTRSGAGDSNAGATSSRHG